MAEWGLSAHEAMSLPARAAERLMDAYIKRKRFEGMVLWSVLGEALGQKKERKMASMVQLSAWGIGVPGGN